MALPPLIRIYSSLDAYLTPSSQGESDVRLGRYPPLPIPPIHNLLHIDMSPRKVYVCSKAHCTETFPKFTDLKKHETAHARPERVHTCNFPGCDFTTLQKRSFEIHYARHTGEQRYVCPHNCDFRTHDPSALTRHRKSKHGYVPPPRGGHVAAPPGSDTTPSSSLPASSEPPQFDGPDPSFDFYDQSNNNFPFTLDLHDFNMFSEPVSTAGWGEGCLCPELMQRRPSEVMGYAYRNY